MRWTSSADRDIWRTRGSYCTALHADIMHGVCCSLPDAVSHTVSMATQPIEPKVSSSHELHNFVKNQRKIITTFRAQPWPMQVKLAALR